MFDLTTPSSSEFVLISVFCLRSTTSAIIVNLRRRGVGLDLFESYLMDVVVINICFAHLSSPVHLSFFGFLKGHKIISQSLSFQHLNTLKQAFQLLVSLWPETNCSLIYHNIDNSASPDRSQRKKIRG